MSSSVSSGHTISDDGSSSLRSSSLSMNEAYRRLGHKLSQRACGVNGSNQVRRSQWLSIAPTSAFSRYSAFAATLNAESFDRNTKVAKTKYTDHGEHQKKSTSILSRLTYLGKQTFSRLEQQHKASQPLHTISPQKAGMKRLSPTPPPHRSGGYDATTKPESGETSRGLLGSLMEHSLTSPTCKKCLTAPADPVSENSGRDNVEGNLIVFEGDIITATSTLQTLQGTPKQSLRVISLLGQGTFAQVFLCQCLDSGDKIALKVVKNKQAYTQQAAVEIDVFRALSDSPKKENMVQLMCYFMYHSHLCLVFELLGLNLYEILKRRQFRGLGLTTVRTLLGQAMEGIQHLSQKQIVHCDLKPENILIASDVEAIVGDGAPTKQPDNKASQRACAPKIKLIDFGSACFEGHTSHTYIQSRFYRSPEVLVGLPYDSAIDMWSMGCVAAELFLGLPILPGVHEHDQLGRILEMIGNLPDWMMDQGSKAPKYFVKRFAPETGIPSRSPSLTNGSSPPPARSIWRIKTQAEYIQSLSASEIRKKGGLAKFEKQHANRYFKRKKLADIVMLHGGPKEDQEQLSLFVHFLKGILDPDPWKRWTAFQAIQHPFITGVQPTRKSDDANAIFWDPPWDPSICGRKLLKVQKMRERQPALRRSLGNARNSPQQLGLDNSEEVGHDNMAFHRMEPASPCISGNTSTSRVTAMTDAMSLSRQSNSLTVTDRTSSPSYLGFSTSSNLTSQSQQLYPNPPKTLDGGLHESLGSAGHVNGSAQYMTASSLGDYSPQHSMPNMAMMSMHGMSYGETANHQAQLQMHMLASARSYGGGMSYDGLAVPVDADFAYALQRPGVVPGAELSGSYSSVNQQLAAYTPHHNPQQQQGIGLRPGSYGRPGSYLGISGNSLGRNSSGRSRYNPQGMPESPHSLHRGIQPNYLHNAPTSIREDGSDYQLGQSLRSGGSSVASGSSLLSQQLEAQHQHQQQLHQQQQESNMRDAIYASQSRLQVDVGRQHHAQQVSSIHKMYGGAQQGTMYPPQNVYYGGAYVSGAPLQHVMAPASLSHISYSTPGYENHTTYGAPSQIQGGPIYSGAPAFLAPPTFEELERAQKIKQQLYQGHLQNAAYGGLSM